MWLDEKYENRQYQFEVAGEEFSGYLTDSEITHIEEEDIATVITERHITKMCDQLDHSMGSYMEYFQFLCTLLSAVLIYLLTKIIIEKNENAISMTKILGYENREIAGLYLLSTTVLLIAADAVSVILGTFIMAQAWKNNHVQLQRLVYIFYQSDRVYSDVCICPDRVSDRHDF